MEEATLKQDLGSLLLDLELRQTALIRQRVARQREPETALTEAERTEALELLQDPQLISRILADYATCGLVGEETNKLAPVGWWLLVGGWWLTDDGTRAYENTGVKICGWRASHHANNHQPTTTNQLVAGQSLYYLGRDELRHKVLAVAEEEGVTQASYALKLLQSEGRLALAVASKTRDTGRSQTECYEVEGPVALLLTLSWLMVVGWWLVVGGEKTMAEEHTKTLVWSSAEDEHQSHHQPPTN